MMKKIVSFLLGCWLFLSPALGTCSSFFEGSVIQGFNLEKVEQGKKIYSLKAEEATFGNKRLGFFSLSFIKVMNLKNVDLDLYCDGKVSQTQHFEEAVFEISTGRLLDQDGKVIFHE